MERYGERIAVGIDARDGVVKTAGWEDSSGLDYLDFAVSVERIGVKMIIFTDIETDGMLTGPSWDHLEKLQRKTTCRIIASGGVSSNEDIRACGTWASTGPSWARRITPGPWIWPGR